MKKGVPSTKENSSPNQMPETEKKQKNQLPSASKPLILSNKTIGDNDVDSLVDNDFDLDVKFNDLEENEHTLNDPEDINIKMSDPAVEEITKDLTDNDSDLWSVPTMTLAIEYKKENRTDNKVMNCFVLNLPSHGHAGHNEYQDFLNNLVAHFKEIKEGTRFQLAVRQGVHWSAIDVQVTSSGIDTFILDTVPNYKYTMKLLNPIQQTIQNRLLESKIYTLSEAKSYQIQSDSSSCSRFTLDNLFHLQTLNVFKTLEKSPNVIDEDKNFKVVSLANLPIELTFLLRNTQSLSTLKKYNQNQQNKVINKKGQTLAESVKLHTREYKDEETGNSKKRNYAIENFRDKMELRVMDFIDAKTSKQLKDIIQQRTGLDYLTKGQKYRDKMDGNQIQSRNAPSKFKPK